MSCASGNITSWDCSATLGIDYRLVPRKSLVSKNFVVFHFGRLPFWSSSILVAFLSCYVMKNFNISIMACSGIDILVKLDFDTTILVFCGNLLLEQQIVRFGRKKCLQYDPK